MPYLCASVSSPARRSISAAAAALTWASRCWPARSRELGHEVAFETPRRHLPVYTAERLLFNRGLKPSAGFDLTVGFDMDGYRIATEAGHVAALKGVIADEVRFERGLTRLTMADPGALRAAARAARGAGAGDQPLLRRAGARALRRNAGAGYRAGVDRSGRVAGGAGRRKRAGPRRTVPGVVRGSALPAQAGGRAAAGRGLAARTHPRAGSAHRGQRTVRGAAPAACRAS